MNLCILDGKQNTTRYYACADVGQRPYNKIAFRYIGDGVVYSVNGIKQPGYNRYSFFTVRPGRPRRFR